MTVRTDVDIALGVVSEGGTREHAISSFVPFPHWNIRRDVLAQEPGQHLARSIGGIGCEPFRFQTECLFSPINHGSRRCHLVIGACRRGLNVDNHSMPGVDQIVEAIAKLNPLARLCSPRRTRIHR